MGMAIVSNRRGLPDGLERRLRPRAPVLTSWKEIASYLKCGVRTAQRWERDRFLPVYRPRPGKRGPVCAFPSEIQIWLRRNKLDGDGLAQPEQRNSAIILTHKLTHQSTELVRLAAENSRLQLEYAARLVKTIENLKARVRRTSRIGRTL